MAADTIKNANEYHDTKIKVLEIEKEILTTQLEAYENDNSVGDELPDPITAIKSKMTQHGLRQVDLISCFGSSGKASEILSGKKPLTLPIIRALSDRLEIPIEVLAQEQK